MRFVQTHQLALHSLSHCKNGLNHVQQKCGEMSRASGNSPVQKSIWGWIITVYGQCWVRGCSPFSLCYQLFKFYTLHNLKLSSFPFGNHLRSLLLNNAMISLVCSRNPNLLFLVASWTRFGLGGFFNVYLQFFMWEPCPDPFPWHSWESFKGVPGKLNKTWMMLFVITGGVFLGKFPSGWVLNWK